ncbi:MAG: hypothetical protein H7338_05815 [Candidatus Sericytochromatia bacterium]|nr:hypothetical protein [Candidatus Sericytochromatia bacterium]
MKRIALAASCTMVLVVSGCGSSPTVPPTPLNPVNMTSSSMTPYGPNPQMAKTNANPYATSPTDSAPPEEHVATGTDPVPSPSPTVAPSPSPTPASENILPLAPTIEAPEVPVKKSVITKVVDAAKSVGSKIIGIFKKKP